MTTRTRLDAELATRRYTRRHAREIVTAVLGNNSGTVVATADTRWYWIRLHGDPNQVVRAWNAGFVPPVNNLPVDIEIVKGTGITDYQIIGVSINKGVAADAYAGAIGMRALQHQRRDFNTGGFDPLDIYARAIVQLRARAQATPDMTLYVEPGWYPVAGIATYFAGGNSPAFVAPGSGFRCDLLYLDNTGTLRIVTGTAIPFGTPTRPAQPLMDDLPLAYVYLTATTTSITEYLIEDGRVVFGGAGGNATKAITNVSNPPTEAQTETAFAAPATWARKLGHLDDNGLHSHEYEALSDDAAFWFSILARARPATTIATATNAAAAQTTPTHDGSGQSVHPSILYFPNGWNGKKYWLVLTPFPAGSAAHETPDILCSDDGATWAVPGGLTNPIEPDAGLPAYNSDPFLVAVGATVYCFWRYSDGSTVDTIYFRKSTDGVTWASKTSVISAGFATLLSPAFVYDGAQYVMWHVDSTGANALKRRTVATIEGAWSAAGACTINGAPAGKDIWHISVIKRGAEYHAFMVFCDTGTNGDNSRLYFATSSDGITWTVSSSVLLGPTVASWDQNSTYQSAAVITETGYDLWYSAWNNANVYHIGRTTVTLTNLVLANLSRLVGIRDTQANIEALGGTLEEMAVSYATDLDEFGIYSGGQWHWIASFIVHTLSGAYHTGNLTQARSHDSPDTDVAAGSLHHTIGAGATQAAAGNHTHAGGRIAPLTAELIAWDDVRVGGESTKPGATAPALTAFGPSGNLKVLFFENGHHDEVHFEIQMPHTWKIGSKIYPHVHWTPVSATAGNVVWELEYVWKDIGGTFGAPSTMASDATAAGGTAWVHKMTYLKDGGGNNYIDGSGISGISSMLECRLHRNAGVGSDTLVADVAFLEFDVHYQIDSFGSDFEASKTAGTRYDLVWADGDLVMCEV